MRRYLTPSARPHLIALIVGLTGLLVGLSTLTYLMVIGQPGAALLLIVAARCVHYTDTYFRGVAE